MLPSTTFGFTLGCFLVAVLELLTLSHGLHMSNYHETEDVQPFHKGLNRKE